jgi:hypothetical protein
MLTGILSIPSTRDQRRLLDGPCCSEGDISQMNPVKSTISSSPPASTEGATVATGGEGLGSVAGCETHPEAIARAPAESRAVPNWRTEDFSRGERGFAGVTNSPVNLTQ